MSGLKDLENIKGVGRWRLEMVRSEPGRPGRMDLPVFVFPRKPDMQILCFLEGIQISTTVRGRLNDPKNIKKHIDILKICLAERLKSKKYAKIKSLSLKVYKRYVDDSEVMLGHFMVKKGLPIIFKTVELSKEPIF